MATGIVSSALALDGYVTLSRLALVAAGAVWVALGALVVARALSDLARVRREARSPAALTAVAATAVLGTRLSVLGWRWAGAALLALATATWFALLRPVLEHWSMPTVGGSLMLTVSTQSLAVLAATVSPMAHSVWLLDAALALIALGLAFYAVVMSRFDVRQLATGRGDHWVTAGGLAISALAADQAADAIEAFDALHGIHPLVEAVSVALWVGATCWLPVLVAAELRWRRLGYHARRWATVFPVGMYAACSSVVGTGAHAPAITAVGRVATWVGVAVWLAVAAGTVRRGLHQAERSAF